MKQAPEWNQIEDNLRPGRLSASGFLGDDPRSLSEIIQTDQIALQRLHLTDQAVAARLRTLTDAAKSGLGKPVLVERHYEVVVEDFMGQIPCPFRDNLRADKRLTTLRNLKANRILRWSDLNIHLIEKHGFYEGVGSPFRLDPDVVSELLFD
jgi:hypothetical protein